MSGKYWWVKFLLRGITNLRELKAVQGSAAGGHLRSRLLQVLREAGVLRQVVVAHTAACLAHGVFEVARHDLGNQIFVLHILVHQS